MTRRTRQKTLLGVALFPLVVGVQTLRAGHAEWYGDGVGISGLQATLFGWACITFAAGLVVAFLVGEKRS